MKTVLATFAGFKNRNPEAAEMLAANGFRFFEKASSDSLLSEKHAEALQAADIILAGTDRLDKAVFDRAAGLRLIVKLGTGMDNIDLREAGARGIAVGNTRGINANAVAEMTIALILSLVRHIPRHDRQTKAGKWLRPPGNELKGKKVGLVGFGAIPKLIAMKLGGFEVDVSAFDIVFQPDAAQLLHVSLVSFDELLNGSDIISVHVPGTPENRHLFGEAAFSKMRDGALFLNLSRGNVIDTEALSRALTSGKLEGAAVDVYEQEPPDRDNVLFPFENVICTPHVAGMTKENMRAECKMAVTQMIDFFRDDSLPNRIE